LIELLKDKTNSIALIGASNDESKYGFKILLDLKHKGHEVLPINLKLQKILSPMAMTTFGISQVQKVKKFQTFLNQKIKIILMINASWL